MDSLISGTHRKHTLNRTKLLEWIDNSRRQASASDPDSSKGCLDEVDLASALYEACLRLYEEQWKVYRQHNSRPSARHARLREQLGSLLLWGETLTNSELSSCLDGFPDIRNAVIEVLCNIGKTMIRSAEIPEGQPKNGSVALNHGDITTNPEATLVIERLLEEARLLQPFTEIDQHDDLESYTSENEDPFEHSSIDETGTDLGLHAVMQVTVGSGKPSQKNEPMSLLFSHKFGGVRFIRDMASHIASLQDLAPTLEQMLDEVDNSQTPGTATVCPSFQVSNPARSFVLQIHDRYRSAPTFLVERLGEANWQRFVRIRSQIDGCGENENEVEEQDIAHSTFQPVSKFHDSGLGTSMPAQSSYAFSTASHTSFLSSHTDVEDGIARVPATPEQVAEGRPFACFICGQTLTKIKTRIDWKLHIFKDLQPYICTFESCRDMLVTFPTRTLWAEHEFSVHRHRQCLKCYQCRQELHNEVAFKTHLDLSHSAYLNDKQFQAAVSSARSTVQKPIVDEQCPVCPKSESPSMRAFVSHVGRHMEGIALASLPRCDDNESEPEDVSRPTDGLPYIQRSPSPHDGLVTIKKSWPIGSLPSIDRSCSSHDGLDKMDTHRRSPTVPSMDVLGYDMDEVVESFQARSPEALSPDQTALSYEATKEKGGICPLPDCGRGFRDLPAHMLTHQSERPPKCPILSCQYYSKGFARKYDLDRHTLTHYKGTMVCGFCPGSARDAERSFNRADVFKRHLVAVHRVEQIPPNSGKRFSTSSTTNLTRYSEDANGKCSTCLAVFSNAQQFYEHLDQCVLRIIQQESAKEAHNQ